LGRGRVTRATLMPELAERTRTLGWDRSLAQG
jgi:hypothetical protein